MGIIFSGIKNNFQNNNKMVTEINGVKSYTFEPKGDNINSVEKYVFKREWGFGNMAVPVGTEISKVHGCIYYNGGLLSTDLQQTFLQFIEQEKRNGFHFLKPDMPIYNKC